MNIILNLNQKSRAVKILKSQNELESNIGVMAWSVKSVNTMATQLGIAIV